MEHIWKLQPVRHGVMCSGDRLQDQKFKADLGYVKKTLVQKKIEKKSIQHKPNQTKPRHRNHQINHQTNRKLTNPPTKQSKPHTQQTNKNPSQPNEQQQLKSNLL